MVIVPWSYLRGKGKRHPGAKGPGAKFNGNYSG
jgi:hypothetical protein